MRRSLTGVDELASHLKWLFDKRLRVIEELATNPQVSSNPGPSEDEANRRVLRAEKLGDSVALEEARVDLIRAQMWQWWPDFPERQLLIDLYRRANLHRARRGSNYSRRRPTRCEGLRVARALLAETEGKSGLDPAKEFLAVTETLMRHNLAQSGRRRFRELEDYIERSVDNQVYFDALVGILYVLTARGEDIPRLLAVWWGEVDEGRRVRPQLASIPFHRPVNSAHLVRDFQICFVIGILHRVRVPPRGSPVSGCEIVSVALDVSEATVERIWKGRMWKKSPEPLLRKHLEAISERTGLVYGTEA